MTYLSKLRKTCLVALMSCTLTIPSMQGAALANTTAPAKQQPAAADQQKLAKSWTCNATISLISTNVTFTVPSWTMTGGALVDRQAKCKEHIKSQILHNGLIWSYIKPQLTPAQQDAICKAGLAGFRVDYGLTSRPKEWQFVEYPKAPPCNCPTTCPQGYSISGNGNCAKGTCPSGNLPNSATFSNGQGYFIWNGTLYHQVSPTPSGPCSFK